MQPSRHIQTIRPSYIRQILSVTEQSNIISLAGGLPADEALPIHIVNQVMDDVLSDEKILQYSTTAGCANVRDYFRKKQNIHSSHDVLMTSGAQQALDLCARTFIAPNDQVLVEEPCYLGALQVFNLARANILSVAQCHDGPNIEELETLFIKGNIKLFYAVPDFHNPTGCCWSLLKRKAVAELCQRYQVLLLEDAPYRELRFDGVTLPTVSSFCPKHAIIIHSFSKVLAPGLRVAALVTPNKWFSTLITVKQAMDLHTSPVLQQLAMQVMQHPQFLSHQNLVLDIYKKRYQSLLSALEVLPQACAVQAVQGGMFVWLKVSGYDQQLAHAALSQGVAVVPGSEFYLNSVKAQEAALRLNFTNTPSSVMVKAIERLKLVFKQV